MDGKILKDTKVKKYIGRTLFLSVCVALISLMAISCQDYRNNNVPDDSVYIVKSGENIVKLTSDYDLSVYRAGKFGTPGTVSLRFMNPSELDQVNKDGNKTYKLLPKEYFNLKNSSVEFNKNENDALRYISIHFDEQKLKDFLSNHQGEIYVLPIIIDHSSFKINMNKNKSIIIPTID